MSAYGPPPIVCPVCGVDEHVLVCVIQGGYCRACGKVFAVSEEQVRQLYGVIDRTTYYHDLAERFERCLALDATKGGQS